MYKVYTNLSPVCNDSIIFKKPKNVHIPTSEKLGDIKNELSPGCSITAFYSGGPKSYAYQLKQPDGTLSWKTHWKGTMYIIVYYF